MFDSQLPHLELINDCTNKRKQLNTLYSNELMKVAKLDMCIRLFIGFIVDRITRSSSIKMMVLSRIQYNDKEVKNSTIGCMLFLYH